MTLILSRAAFIAEIKDLAAALTRGGVAAVAGVAAALFAWGAADNPKALAAGIYDNMKVLRTQLPPGIVHCRDRAIRIIYAQEVALLWSDFGRVSYRMAGKFDGYYDSVIVKGVSKRIEPAWYVTREMVKWRIGKIDRNWTFKQPQKDVPQIFAFDEGIKLYFFHHRWNGTNVSPGRVEDRLIHSIAYASLTEVFHYETEEERCMRRVANNCIEYKPPSNTTRAETAAQEYLRSGWDGKRNVLRQMRRALQEMGNGDVASTNPLDPYNRKLAAAWAAYYLSNHYWNLYESNPETVTRRGDKHLGQLITDLIAVPLIDPVGYNIVPFKGQPLYTKGVKHRKNVGYTERRYFEQQR